MPFTKGHPYYRPYSKNRTQKKGVLDGGWKRTFRDEFEGVAQIGPDGAYSTNDSDGKPGAFKFLRPKWRPKASDPVVTYVKEHKEDEQHQWDGFVHSGEMLLLEESKLLSLVNTAVRCHMNTDCNNIELQFNSKVKWGACWKVSIGCSNCKLSTGLSKMYTEVKRRKDQRRGPLPATNTVALAIGMQDHPIGPKSTEHLLTTGLISAPSKRQLQRTSNIVSEKVSQLTKRETDQKVTDTVKVNMMRGVESPFTLNAEFDGRYNSTRLTNSYRPGLGSSQAVAVMCENTTDSKSIIGYALQNKLCPQCSHKFNKGKTVKPGSHPGCCANIAETEVFSESKMAEEIADRLADRGVSIKNIVTDGDEHGAKGVQQSMLKRNPRWTTTRIADPRHLGVSQLKAVTRCNFSDRMFVGMRTVKQKSDAKKLLAKDIRSRTSKLVHELCHKHAGNTEAIVDKVDELVEITLDCYSGKHKRCKRGSLVCAGKKGSLWFNKSRYLKNSGIRKLRMKESDRKQLKDILAMRLQADQAAIMVLQTKASTNKCEAVNRGISKSLPKNITYSRNAAGRLASSVLRMNDGPGLSSVKKLQYLGVDPSRSSTCTLQLEKLQREHVKRKHHQKRAKTKLARCKSANRRWARYLKNKKAKPNYRKGQLDLIRHNIRAITAVKRATKRYKGAARSAMNRAIRTIVKKAVKPQARGKRAKVVHDHGYSRQLLPTDIITVPQKRTKTKRKKAANR